MRVVVVASHSGGHICPAIAFSQGLRDKRSDVEINFITTDGQIEKKLLNNDFKPIYFERHKATILNGYKLITLFFKARRLIKTLKPDLVVGFGGYLTIPFIIFAKLQKVPNFIHEQNVKLGKANKFLINFTDKLILSFPNSQISNRLKDKALLLGLPLRRELKKSDKKTAKMYFGFDARTFTILIIGGSQGSASMNSKVVKFLESADFSNVGVIHITGAFDYEWIRDRYKKLNIKYRVFSFTQRMDYCLSACDLAISRAGAGILAEIISLEVPSILIPYPFAKLHQLDNARILTDKHAAILLEDKFLSSDILKEMIIGLRNDQSKLHQLSESLKSIDMPSSRENLAEFALGFARYN